MDQALRIAIRQYAAEPTPENAQSLARLYLRSLGIPAPSNIPEKYHEYLTYAGLLRRLLKLTDDQLAATVTVYNTEHDEYQAMTDLHIIKDTDILVAGHPVIVRHNCRRCLAPLGQPEISDHFAALDNEGVGPPGH